MVQYSKKFIKALFLIVLAVATIIVLNHLLESSFGGWSLSVAAGIAILVMWPVMDYFFKKGRIAGIIYKIDSKAGLNLIDSIGRKYRRFWVFIGNFAIVSLFGGIGGAFVAYHLSEKWRKILVGALSFLVFYVVISNSLFSIFPPTLQFNFSLLGLAVGLLATLLIYRLPYTLSKRNASLLAFALTFLFFAYPYLASFTSGGGALSLAFAAFAGSIGPPGVLILQFAIVGFTFAFGAMPFGALQPTLPAIEDGVPVLKDTGGLGISIPIFPDILIAFVVLLVLHEGFHGLVARAQNIPVKHTGLAMFSIIPLGAFVEPDEEKFQKEKPDKQARVYAVGSFANIAVLALVSIIIGSAMLSAGLVESEGMVVGFTEEPASEYLSQGDILKSIDSKTVGTVDDFYSAMSAKIPNETIVVETDNGSFDITLGTNPRNSSVGYLGVAPMESDRTLALFAPSYASSKISDGTSLTIFNFLKWLFIINLSVGLFNLLPIQILDGYGSYKNMFKWLEDSSKWGKKHKIGTRLLKGLSFMVVLIIFLNIVPYLF
jgi:hypothetical protein